MKKQEWLPKEVYRNRKLVLSLAKNDFKTKYAGSYFGTIWAFVQPIVTICVYWFVFGLALRGGSEREVPFVLWLVAGLVPWFFLQEGLMGGTSAMLEYNYLVKKVVFKISILPIIKIIAAAFIHVFFIGILLLIGILYGYYPSLYTIQIFYYSFCLFVFVLGLCYTTCSVIVFFRDLGQIINILLQVGMWATPIMWDIHQFGPRVQMLVKINPLVYIVNGYRSAIYEKTWFFEDFYSTMYFWIITVVIFGLGALVFKRLKVHFSDVL